MNSAGTAATVASAISTLTRMKPPQGIRLLPGSLPPGGAPMPARGMPPDARCSARPACWHQPDDPNWMGTLMACVAGPGGGRRAASCQTVSLVRWTARASNPPAGPGASVAVPAGSAGSGRHGLRGPVMVWRAVAGQDDRGGAAGPEGCRGQRRAAAAAAAATGPSGCRCRWTRRRAGCAAGPVPAASSATVRAGGAWSAGAR